MCDTERDTLPGLTPWANEVEFRTLIDNLPQRVYVKDAQLVYVACNRSYAQDLVLTPGEVVGRTDLDLHPRELATRYQAEDRHVLARGERTETEEPYEVGGRERCIHTIRTPLLNARGEPAGIVGTFWDITQRRAAERALRESERKFAAMADSAQDAIILLDDGGRIAYWNRAAEQTLGYARDEALGRDLHEWIAPEPYRAPYRAAFPRFRTSGEGDAVGRTLELSATRKGGETFPIELSVSAVRLDGRWHAIGILRDITQRKRAERERRQMETQLRHAQKLEAIGQLAAGIAHEINTPAQFVGDNTRFVQESWADLTRLLEDYRRIAEAARRGPVPAHLLAAAGRTARAIDLDYLREEVPKAIAQSLEGLQRIASIVRAMKEFSHPGGDEKTPTDINQAIRSTIEVSRNEWKYHADLVADLDPSLPLVPCLPNDFNRVVLNLIVNAAHAIAEAQRGGEKGTITVRTRAAGGFAQVSVADTGTGIPEAIRHRIFEPFFTTKEVGKGTGQGLAIAYAVVVDRHGGHIDVDSREGRGTTFTVHLPLVAPRPAGAAP